jgi:hypothetical protein
MASNMVLSLKRSSSSWSALADGREAVGGLFSSSG